MRRTVVRLLKGLFLSTRGAAPRRHHQGSKRLVWRISEANPRGAWVDPDAVESAPPVERNPPETTSSGWLTSSMDLLGGAEVREHPPLDDHTNEDTAAGVFIDTPQPSVPPRKN